MISVCIAFVLMGWHAHRFQNVVRPILTIMLLGSLIFGVTSPELAIHQELAPELLGAWRGLTNHKNGLGALACIVLIFWVHAGVTRQVRIPLMLAGCMIAGTCLLLSRSSTALLAAAIVITFLLGLLRSPLGLRPYVPYVVVFMTATLLICALAVLQLVPGIELLMAPISTLMDRPMTFTGRTEIWAIISEHISNHPAFGTGYGAYWTAGPIPGTDSYAFIARSGSFYPGSAHNGYLEVANDLGWTGLLCLFGYIATMVLHSLRLARVEGTQAALYLALIFEQLITNFSESHWFSVLSVDFVIVTLATTALARGLLELELRSCFGEPSRGVEKIPIERSAPTPRGAPPTPNQPSLSR
jgi:exopolysaccharide production protein ExoQ